MKPKLPFIVFELTRNCNLNCMYCYNHWKVDESKEYQETTFKQAKKTIKQLFKIADTENISLSGGEPFLLKKLPELILFLRLKKKNVNIISNGTIISKDNLQNINHLGIGAIEFPLHSHIAEHHELMTRNQGSWQKSLNSIEHALKVGINIVSVIILTKFNYRDIEETILFHKQIGIKQIMLNRFNIGGNGINDLEKLNLNPHELNQTLKKADRLAIKEGVRVTSNVCSPMCLVKPDDFQHIRFTHCSSDIKKMPITLELNGDLRICNHSPLVFGNIFQDEIIDLLANPEIQPWANKQPEICKGCNLYSTCMGGCRAAALQFYGDAKRADPYFELYPNEQTNSFKKNSLLMD
ncbi:MAG: radical SAM protein [Bacteroidetes bacterium]|nr:radical SAM protein [Bacteroidota bacterium]